MREKEVEEIHCKLWDRNLRFSLVSAFVAVCCMYFEFVEMASFFWVIFLTMSNFQMVRQGHKDDICLYQRSAELMKKSDICKKLLYGNEKIEALFSKKTITSTWITVVSFVVAMMILWSGLGLKIQTGYFPVMIIVTGEVVMAAVMFIDHIYFSQLRYKRITFKNIQYWLGFVTTGRNCAGLTTIERKLPKQYKLGKCKIIKKKRCLYRTYYVVETKKTGLIYKKVLYCGAKKLNSQTEYILYEICGVYYMQ